MTRGSIPDMATTPPSAASVPLSRSGGIEGGESLGRMIRWGLAPGDTPGMGAGTGILARLEP